MFVVKSTLLSRGGRLWNKSGVNSAMSLKSVRVTPIREELVEAPNDSQKINEEIGQIKNGSVVLREIQIVQRFLGRSTEAKASLTSVVRSFLVGVG